VCYWALEEQLPGSPRCRQNPVPWGHTTEVPMFLQVPAEGCIGSERPLWFLNLGSSLSPAKHSQSFSCLLQLEKVFCFHWAHLANPGSSPYLEVTLISSANSLLSCNNISTGSRH
jgi:hypothetical protein